MKYYDNKHIPDYSIRVSVVLYLSFVLIGYDVFFGDAVTFEEPVRILYVFFASFIIYLIGIVLGGLFMYISYHLKKEQFLKEITEISPQFKGVLLNDEIICLDYKNLKRVYKWEGAEFHFRDEKTDRVYVFTKFITDEEGNLEMDVDGQKKRVFLELFETLNRWIEA
jgi:hypothetical protein